ncbi:MAG: hypothetical protein LBQ47_05895 [Endomicrobium sp.]|jgi:outer membrane protein assembly factor BamA|nr:hypothetical protein [Endomicrobium sp.]
MKKITILAIILSLLPIASFAQDAGVYDGKTVRAVNVKTLRVKPSVVKKKFPISQGDTFTGENYDLAKQALHDMRIFKTIDFAITENEDASIDINIDAKDGFYVFPLIMGTGGSKSTFAAALMEANLFKLGEAVFLFGAFNSDGYAATGAFGLKNSFFSLGFGGFEYKEKVFKNGSFNSSGLFSSSSDNLENFGKPVKEYGVDAKSIKMSWSKSLSERTSVSAGADIAQVKYTGQNIPQDSGSHNKISVSIRHSKNFSASGSGIAMGALLGIGLSDIKDRLADLPKTKYGYAGSISYENGGTYLGADYSISKLSLKVSAAAELKKRHVLNFGISAAKAFETPYFDTIRSVEMLSSKGIYSRDFRGEEAAGANVSFTYYLIKNKTGLLTVMPFAETAVVRGGSSVKNHSGVGATVSYRLWRIPFPIGLNYTHNVSDGSYSVSFLFGG